MRLVKGRFEDTLRRYDGGPIALLHVDADLYASYRSALDALWPKIAPGGIAAFDEYEEAETWPGARRAVDEFIAELPRRSFDLVHDEQSRKWFAVKLA